MKVKQKAALILAMALVITGQPFSVLAEGLSKVLSNEGIIYENTATKNVADPATESNAEEIPEEEKETFDVTYIIDPEEGAKVKGKKKITTGETLSFTVDVKEGYELYQVDVSGDELTAVRNEDGTYWYEAEDILLEPEVTIKLEKTEKPEFIQSQDFDGVTVTVSAKAGVLPEGTYAEILELPADEDDSEEVSFFYDITLYDTEGEELSNEWQKNGSVEVSFTGKAIEEAKEEASEAKILHVDDDGQEETVEKVKLDKKTMEEDGVSFEAEHFSTYGIRFYSLRAAEETVSDYESLKTAIANATPSEAVEIRISGDIAIEEPIVIEAGKDITLVDDGNPAVISAAEGGDFKRNMFVIQEGGKLTLNTSSENEDTLLSLDGTNVQSAFGFDEGIILTVKGEFILKGGTLCNATANGVRCGAVVVNGENAAFRMYGGTITDNKSISQYCGAVLAERGALFEMTGGKISNHTATETNSSAVYITADSKGGDYTGKTRFVLDGGEISGNTGEYGGVFVGSIQPDYKHIAEFEMKSGLISNNEATFTGGGVAVIANGRFTMNGGEISDNKSARGGGVTTYDLYVFQKVSEAGISIEDWAGKYNVPAAFVMNGGIITGNTAYSLENGDGGIGGGVYIASNTCIIRNGEITDNVADQQGGGIYIGSQPYVLQLYDTLITDNTADLLGGGIWLCPTGQATNYVTNGGAIFDNLASENTTDAAGDDVVAVPQENKEAEVTLANRILGGGSVKWFKDGGVVYSDIISDNNVLGRPDGSARFDASNPGDPILVKNCNEALALKAIVSEEAKEIAKDRAKVRIAGNSAKRGGGIGSNGSFVIGEKDNEWTLKVTKDWSTDITEAEKQEVEIFLTIGDWKLDSVKLNQENNWTAEFNELPDPDTLNELEIGVLEDGELYEASYSEISKNEDEKVLAITVTNNLKPVEYGQLEIKKTVTGNAGDQTRNFDFELTLTDKEGKPLAESIKTSKGNLSLTEGKAVFTLKHQEELIIENLPAGTEYRIRETNAHGHTVSFPDHNEEGIIVANTTITVEVENYKYEAEGNLRIKKTVTGSRGNTTQDFDFEMNLTDPDGKPLTGSIETSKGELSLTGGKAAFTLRHQEEITIKNLPAGTKYQVKETNTHGHSVSIPTDNEEGVIALETLITVEVENYKGGGGSSGGGGGGGGGGGTPGKPVTPVTPQPQEPQTPDETPGDVPPVPWYKLPVMGDEQFGPGFVNESNNQVSLPEAQTETESIIPQLKELHAQNNELAGWLTVPGTGFGYPVMLSQNDPYYYQHHTFDKKLDEIGIPFMGPYCNKDSMNVLIHGHNMRDVSQFGYIWNYQYPAFQKKNPTIDFKTLTDENGSYEVMAVFFAPEYAEGTQNVFWWYRYIGDMNKNQFDYFVQNAKALSLYDTGVTAEYGDKLITLETCASLKDSTRLVVVARKKAGQTTAVTQ